MDILLLQYSDRLVAGVAVGRGRGVLGRGLVGGGSVGRLGGVGGGSVGRGDVGRPGPVGRLVGPVGDSHEGQGSDDELKWRKLVVKQVDN